MSFSLWLSALSRKFGDVFQHPYILNVCLKKRIQTHYGSIALLPPLLALILLAGGPGARAETIRLTRWDMRTVPLGSSAKSFSDADRIQLAADVLKVVQPDVILLHHVRDWDMSTRLARALQPEDYRVLICSAFPEAKSAPAGQQQVAILSRRKAYFTWSEPWQAPNGDLVPGGLSFAAIEAGRQRLGIFSIQIEDRLGTALSGTLNSTNAAIANGCLKQWHDALHSYKKWEANRLEAVVVSGSFSKAPDSASGPVARFAHEFLGAPLDRVIPMEPTKDFFSAHLPLNPNDLAGVVISRSPLTCDIHLDPLSSAVPTLAVSTRPNQEVLPPRTDNTMSAAAITLLTDWWDNFKSWTRGLRFSSGWNLVKRWPPELLIGAAAFCSSFGLLILWRSVRRQRRPRARPVSSGTSRLSNTILAGNSGTFVISPSISGSAQDERLGLPAQPLVLIDSSAKTETQSPAFTSLQRPKDALEDRSLREQLTLWLKQKLVQRLISDRAELLHSQQQATLKVMAVDERLSRIEAHLQQQNRTYELRIEELNRELLATKQENRALIHAKIAQVKAEMQAAKARIMAQSGDVS